LLANSTERLQALKTARVVQTLPVPDPVGLLRDLQQIDQLLSSQMLVTLESSLVPGDNVLINSGPLVGLRGKIKRVATESRFVVEVDFIRQGASVVLDESVLLPVPDEKKPTASEMRDKRS
jgi:transcription antitermination factor NusG